MNRHHTADLEAPDVDAGLRQLFARAPRPRLRTGFDRRLDRAIAADAARRRARRRLVVAMWAYWLTAAALSGLIFWTVKDLLVGPARWIGLGGAGCLLAASITYYFLVPFSIRRWRRHKLIGR